MLVSRYFARRQDRRVANNGSTRTQYNQANGINQPRLLRVTDKSSAINGESTQPEIDRSAMTERCRFLQAQLIADAGGDDISTARRVIIHRTCALIVELELRELHWANREPNYFELEQHSRISSNVRRMREAIGLERKPRDVTTLDPLDYTTGFHRHRADMKKHVLKQRREALE